MGRFSCFLTLALIAFSFKLNATSPEVCDKEFSKETLANYIDGSTIVVIALSTQKTLKRFEELNKEYFKEKTYEETNGSYVIAIPDTREFKFLVVQNIKGNTDKEIEVESLTCDLKIALGEPNILFLKKNGSKYILEKYINKSNINFNSYIEEVLKYMKTSGKD